MSAVRGSRLWVVAGLVLALALTAVTYVLVVAPARAEVASVQTQVDDASLQQTVLRHRLRDLETASKQLGGLRAQLAAARAALPATVDTQGLLRRVQEVATATGTLVGAVTIGPSVASGVEGISAVPVTIVLGGPTAGLVDALDRLQSDASRLITVSAGELKQSTEVGSALSLTVQVYSTAPEPAAGTAAPGTAATSGATGPSGTAAAPATPATPAAGAAGADPGTAAS